MRRGTGAYLSSNFAGQLLPPPSASVVQYVYFRGGGYESDAAGLAALGSFFFPMLGRFLLPLVALVLLLVTGEVNGSILLVGVLSLAITVISVIVGCLFLRDERSARWLGAKLQRPLSWMLAKLKRDPIEDAAGAAVQLRVNAARRPARGVGTRVDQRRGQSLPHLPDPARRAPVRRRLERRAVSGRCLRRLRDRVLGWGGVPDHRQRPWDSGRSPDRRARGAEQRSDDALVAAALLWRVFYSVIALPLGAMTLSRFRKANPDVLRREATETT